MTQPRKMNGEEVQEVDNKTMRQAQRKRCPLSGNGNKGRRCLDGQQSAKYALPLSLVVTGDGLSKGESDGAEM